MTAEPTRVSITDWHGLTGHLSNDEFDVASNWLLGWLVAELDAAGLADVVRAGFTAAVAYARGDVA